MKHKIRIHSKTGINEFTVENGSNVLEFLQAQSFFIDAPCGGKRDCGKCKIKVTGDSEGPGEKEASLLGEKLIKAGYRLACKLRISNDLDIYAENGVKEKLDYAEESRHEIKALYPGVAFDIGTTTLAAYLYDMQTKECIDVYSELNPQKAFGADIISRIEFSGRSPETADRVRAVLIKAINGMIKKICGRNSIECSDIQKIVFVGNTAMMHFIMALPVKSIAIAPFKPVTTELQILAASKIGLDLHTDAEAIVFPSAAAFIGADTVAAVMETGIHEKAQTSLLIDLGTNGEIVLGNRDWMRACSTAAGPAFEGANIRCGVGGVDGAIDSVKFNNGFMYSTVGGSKPIGICGSGLVDVIALVLKTGIIDDTGRIADKEEIGFADILLKSRLSYKDGMKAFIIAFGDETANGDDIYITQRDIREYQNAKAAICAGIKILARTAKTELTSISNVYLAGGFGKYMDVENAVLTGIIPAELDSKIKPVGNAAGMGAARGLLSEEAIRTASEISNKIEYTELSDTEGFADMFIENMDFGI